MTVGKISATNPAISNISFYRGEMPRVQKNFENAGDYSVPGNPNRPVHLNSNPYAGPIVKFDALA